MNYSPPLSVSGIKNHLTSCISLLLVLLYCSMNCSAQSRPVIISDTDDYRPLDTTFITGSGFLPYDQVIVQVLHNDSVYADSSYDQHQAWIVEADADGRFDTYWVV